MRTIAVGWNEPLIRASPLAAIRRFWSHYFEFSGRASVAEYWFWGLANLAVYVAVDGFILHWVSPGTSILIKSGPFGPGLGETLSGLQLGSATFADHAVAAPVGFLWATGVWAAITFIPNLSLMVRRLHDANFSGLWALLGIAPPLSIVLVIISLRSSQARGARFDRHVRAEPMREKSPAL